MDKKKTRPGRRPYVATPEDHLKVARMVKMGIHPNDIAKAFNMALRTFRRHFRSELSVTSSVDATLEVLETLHKMATSGTNTNASIFWAKTRAGLLTPPLPNPSDPAANNNNPQPPTKIIVVNNDGGPIENN